MSVGYLLRVLGHPEAMTGAIVAGRAVGMIIMAGLLIALWIVAVRHHDSVRSVVGCCGAALVAVTLLSPVFYPWYALAPLALASAWATSTAACRWIVLVTSVLTLLVLPNGLGVAVLTKFPGAVGVVGTGGFALWRVWRVWQARRVRAVAAG